MATPSRCSGTVSGRSIPIPFVHGRSLGALNMYAHAPNAFSPEVKSLVRALAHLAAAGMAGALKNFDEITLTNRLRRALSTRGVIDQAVGIIIAHQHLTPEEAFGGPAAHLPDPQRPPA